MRDKTEEFDEADCTVLGISFDPPADNEAFRNKHQFPFALLSDVERTVGSAYDAVRETDADYSAFPKRISYLIDPAGIIQRTYEVSDPRHHADEVLADLVALHR